MALLSLLQLNRLAILLEDGEGDLVAVESVPMHLPHESVIARVDARVFLIGRDGGAQLVDSAVLQGLAAVAA